MIARKSRAGDDDADTTDRTDGIRPAAGERRRAAPAVAARAAGFDLRDHHRRHARCRGQSRLVATRAALVARRHGPVHGRRGRSTDDHVASGGDPRRVQRGADPGHRSRWPQRRVRGVGADPRRCRARHHRARRHRRDRRRVGCRRGGRRNVRSRPRVRAAGRARAHRRPLPAELRSGDGRWLGRLPRRRPVLHPLRQDRGHGRRSRSRAGRRDRDPNRRQSRRRRRARSQPAVHRVGRHARRRHPGVAARPSRPRRRTARRLLGPDVRGRRRSVPFDAPPRRHAGRAAALRRPGGGTRAGWRWLELHPARARRGSSGHRRRHDVRGRRVVRDGRSQPPPTRRWSPTGSNTATTRRPCRS